MSFDRHISNTLDQILKVKVKVMHISTVNILEMVKDMANITIFIKCEDKCKGIRLAH